MKKIVRLCLLLVCAAALVLSAGACRRAEFDSEPTEDGLYEGLDRLSFTLNGAVYTLPLPFAELETAGWEILRLDFAEHLVNPVSGNPSVDFGNGEQVMRGFFRNFSGQPLPLREVYLTGVLLDTRVDEEAELRLSGDILIGSTLEEVIETYGYPSWRRDLWEPYEELGYVLEDVSLWIIIDKETSLVVSLEMRISENLNSRLVEERFPVFAAEDFPEAVLAYEAPENLGEDWQMLAVSVDGDLYRLPAPVSAFLENGWAMQGDEFFAWSGDGRYLYLYRGEQSLWVRLYNSDDALRAGPHLFVTMLQVLELLEPETTIPMGLPGGISEHSTMEDVIAAFGEPDDVLDRSGGLRWYRFEAADRNIVIIIDTETGGIRSIAISYIPASRR